MGDAFSSARPVPPSPAQPQPLPVGPGVVVEDPDAESRTSNDGQSSDPRDARPEEKWSLPFDNLAREYRDVAAVLSEEHDRAGYGARLKHIVFGLPGPVIGIVVSGAASLWRSPDAVYLVVPLSSLGAIMTAVHVFLDMAGRAQLHWTYSAKYAMVVSRIDTTLARHVNFRIPADAFFAEIRTEMNNLGEKAPQLPGKGCCGCKKYDSKKALPAPTRAGDIYYDLQGHRQRSRAQRLLLEV